MIDMVAPPTNLIEIDEPSPIEPGNRVPWSELTKARNRKWKLDTSVGPIYFRRLGQSRRDDINLAYAREHPEFVSLTQEVAVLRDFLRQGIPLDQAHAKKLEDLNVALIPVYRAQYIACIVEPDGKGGWVEPIKTLDDLDGLLMALNPDEVDNVYAALREMIDSRPITESSEVLLTVAQEFGVPLADGLTLENMTAEMADALVGTVEHRAEAMRRELKKAANAQ